MHPFYPFVIEVLPKDLAAIVIDYAAIVIRPFKKRCCVICAASHRRLKSNLCTTHKEICPFCLGFLPQSRTQLYCRSCEKAHSWLPIVRKEVMGRDLWQLIYKDSDSPFDFPKLDRDLTWVKPARDEWGRKIDKIDAGRSAMGDIVCAETSRKSKEFAMLRKITCNEFWKRIPTLESLISK